MPLFVLPPGEAIPGQFLLSGQDGIALFYADTCAQSRLCWHSVRRREQSTSPSATVWPAVYAVVGVFFVPRVLPLLVAAVFAPPLFVVVALDVVALDVDVRPSGPVSAFHALCLPGIDAVRLPLIALALGVERPAVVSAHRAPRLLC